MKIPSKLRKYRRDSIRDKSIENEATRDPQNHLLAHENNSTFIKEEKDKGKGKKVGKNSEEAPFAVRVQTKTHGLIW